jgi:stearoyl-CoA desaturase (delta-9 desaturase)
MSTGLKLKGCSAEKRPTPWDQSRKTALLGLLAFGEGWHNNHHGFPYSARQGFHWWQVDLAWYVI